MNQTKINGYETFLISQSENYSDDLAAWPTLNNNQPVQSREKSWINY